jgi:catechol 2,3-dioxygenase-like lactoylglutathione lyase family enzyme
MGGLSDAKAYATVAVSDLPRAISFYRDTLGLDEVESVPHVVTTFACGGTRVEVYESQFAGSNKATAISFEVNDLEAVMADLRQKGVTFEEYDQPGIKTVNGIAEAMGIRSSWIKDPDGNILALGEFSRPG